MQSLSLNRYKGFDQNQKKLSHQKRQVSGIFNFTKHAKRATGLVP